MATVTKDFRVKSGLVVEGSTATVNGKNVITAGTIDAKGDLIVGSADDAVARLAIGTNGQVLTANSGATYGVQWSDPAAVGVFDTQITFEGATADSFETTLTVVDPTADRTITLPNATGTVALTSDVTTHANLTEAHGATGAVVGTTNTQTLTNKTLTSPKINEDVVMSASSTELNILDGATLSTTELNYVDGVTSAIQTQINAKAPLASPTFTGVVTLAQAPTSDLQAATKLYVDNVTAGINFHEAVHAASVSNLAVIYNNGASGVGATLTANTNRAFATLDGESVVLGQRILIKDQTDARQNGIYTLTTVGSASTPWVITRATDADNNPSGELKNGDFCLVINGTVNASYGFVNNSATNPIVIGTDNITYTQFNAGKTIVAGNGLQEGTPGILSIDTAITQTRIENVTDTEIGYLDGVTSNIQTQLNNKLDSADLTEAAQDAVGGILGTGLVYNDIANTINIAGVSTFVQSSAPSVVAGTPYLWWQKTGSNLTLWINDGL